MLSAAFKDAVVHEIELNSGSLPVYDEKDVICFHDLVVPAVARTVTCEVNDTWNLVGSMTESVR